MNVIPAVEVHEPRKRSAMPAPWRLPGEAREGKWARIEREVGRGRFHRDPNCHSGKTL